MALGQEDSQVPGKRPELRLPTTLRSRSDTEECEPIDPPPETLDQAKGFGALPALAPFSESSALEAHLLPKPESGPKLHYLVLPERSLGIVLEVYLDYLLVCWQMPEVTDLCGGDDVLVPRMIGSLDV